MKNGVGFLLVGLLLGLGISYMIYLKGIEQDYEELSISYDDLYENYNDLWIDYQNLYSV